jgi:hypothetical protein
MRFWIELAGVPIGITELDPHDRAVGEFESLPAYVPGRVIFREGGNALWDLLSRPRQSARGRRWRARLVARMQLRTQALTLRTASGIGVATARVFLFDSARFAGPPVVVVHFGEPFAGMVACVAPPPRERGDSARPAA